MFLNRSFFVYICPMKGNTTMAKNVIAVGRPCKVIKQKERTIKMNYKYTFTIFTPVFNRKDTLHRVWESLNAQTYTDFEWIVVDDASTDNVKPLIESYQREAHFSMKVHYHEHNKGKHFAWNYAINEAQGKFFVPADADDSFDSETLEKFYMNWNSIPEQEQGAYSGINVLCKEVDTGKIIGTPFPNDPFVSDNLELCFRVKVKGEKWGMIRTEVLREFPLPEIATKCGYYPESYIWFSLAKKGYKVLCVNDALRYYFTDTGNSVLSQHRKNPIKSSGVVCHYTAWHLNNNLGYMFSSMAFKEVAKSYISLIRNGLLIGFSIRKQLKSLTGFINRTLFIGAIIPGILMYYITYGKFKSK